MQSHFPFRAKVRPAAGWGGGVLCLLLSWLLAACAADRPAAVGARVPLKYASLLVMEEADSFTRVIVRDAWKPDAVLATYVLVPAAQPLPAALPAGTVVRTPLRRAVATTSVHAALLLDLGATRSLAGLTDTAYIVSPALRRHLRLHPEVRPMGTALQPDLERLRAARADAVLVSPFENAGHGTLSRLGIPLIECADYMETSPLGRAEWMRFYGRLFGCAARADSLFRAVEARYEALRRRVRADSAVAPTVFCDLRAGATWYQPGGASTMGRFIADAGGRYLWADRPESGSLPLDLESVYARAARADLWLVKYGAPSSLTYAQLRADFPPYARFRAWQRRRIWACNTLHTPFYEEVPFHPDRLLANLIALFRPHLQFADTCAYYRPLGGAE